MKKKITTAAAINRASIAIKMILGQFAAVIFGRDILNIPIRHDEYMRHAKRLGVSDAKAKEILSDCVKLVDDASIDWRWVYLAARAKINREIYGDE